MTRRQMQPWVRALGVVLGLGYGANAAAATLQIVNLDPEGIGFNDPTPAPSAPNNSGATIGEQKLAVVQWAANRIGQLLYSPVPIVVEIAHDDTLFCDENGATLAAAGPAWLLRRSALIADHPDLPTWYPSALGQRLLGTTIFEQDVTARVNPNLGASDCLAGFEWYYGLDGEPSVGTQPFVDTMLHELTHGVGFSALSGADGVISQLDPTAISPYFAYAYDTGTEQFWWQMNAEQRSASAVGGLLVWAGPRTTSAAGQLLAAGLDADDHPYMYAPAQFNQGSSLSHFDTSASPNLLMEPFAQMGLDVFNDDIDLALELLHDMGWRDVECGNGIVEGEEECDLGAANDPNADAPDECTSECAWFVQDDCPDDPNKTTPGACGCGVVDTDSDGDLTVDCLDACPTDPNKWAPGVCGCGTPDTDDDADTTPNCVDGCPQDGNKLAPGQCGCGTADTDGDADGTPNCLDDCASDPLKLEPGLCGCGTPDTDTDRDGTADCDDECDEDPSKLVAGLCGCGVSDADDDSDGVPSCFDDCPFDAAKVTRGVCGCGQPESDSDADGALDCTDDCPGDPAKVERGLCGCGIPDTDRDRDGAPDCVDGCPIDASKSSPGACGCGLPDRDSDDDGLLDCEEECPANARKTEPGQCGCATPDDDSDRDGTADCRDECPTSALKVNPGVCGCEVADEDSDGDRMLDCDDECPRDRAKVVAGECGCGVPDLDDDDDGVFDCHDRCPDDQRKQEPGVCGCGESDRDSDRDGLADCLDECPDDPDKTTYGDCGCGVSERDRNRNGTKDCLEECAQGEDPESCLGEQASDADAGADAGPGDAGARQSLTASLLERLRDGGTVSNAEIQAWLADGGDIADLPPEVVEAWVKAWARDGGASVKISPELPEACQCSTPGQRRGPPTALLLSWLLGAMFVARRANLSRRATKESPRRSR